MPAVMRSIMQNIRSGKANAEDDTDTENESECGCFDRSGSFDALPVRRNRNCLYPIHLILLATTWVA